MTYRLLMEDNSAPFIYHNALVALGLLDSNKENWIGSIPKGKEAARKVVEFLETALLFYPEPKKELEVSPPNNFYNWGIMYSPYPPLSVLQVLWDITDQDFGYDLEAWRNWLNSKDKQE